ncbi:butyrate kinase [Listeria welshimeri]|uniref:Probable butyrate kinase n=2 Tax=Listeria welshimeri TaxID=1643 RepID=BUK_LISW6|nr:butyrate kinase [Listeria welshimeri]A0AIH1.1 RecName: Full=Probable butyrate kinase; Short=BK; AltName: Full=Branched-chain carboxylic acid kinase [Listeria welshimeri serovar 6b str. SLCC5334]MBC1243376.1 butyrate kinase [Listeria welshimeri]MBC1251865.1 butyrate kinase [Listeria welshimeri]MBC1324053.1 butyrate kinase [Listeria welshimeri]MBC1403782.1 butyrate kinase [Listeria welshimeri]MBC1590159.1 butyrate kinase [Listeria welshimeri]
MSFDVLTINPGSTSTKLAVYQGDKVLFEETVRHTMQEFADFNNVQEQFDFRWQVLRRVIDAFGYDVNNLDAVVGRGGLLRPVAGGTYMVTEKMLADLKTNKYGEHASNLGAMLAKKLADTLDIPSFIVDPVVVDEMLPIARFSGNELIARKSIFHALNHKAAGRKIAKKLGSDYEKLNFVIAHLGGGISVAAHRQGKAVDVNNALDGDGPFSPERSGSLPMNDFLEACFSGKWNKRELHDLIIGRGGMISYLGTNSMLEVEAKVKAGDEKAIQAFDAMAYQVSKEIGACSTVLHGKIDAIILTGGLARSDLFTSKIIEQTNWIASVIIEPGEDELEALNSGVQRVLAGLEKEKLY